MNDVVHDGKEERLHHNEDVPCDGSNDHVVADDDDVEDDDDDEVEDEYFNSSGLWVPGGFVRDRAVYSVWADSLPPIIDYATLLKGSDFTDDEHFDDESDSTDEDSAEDSDNIADVTKRQNEE